QGLTLCNSALAQGGVAAVIDEDNDNQQLHINDTLIAGGYKNNLDNVKVLANEGPIDVRKLIELGVEFDRNDDGTLNLTLEGGHSRRRIVHHKDSTGFEIVSKLIEAVKALPNVDIYEKALLCGLVHGEVGFSADVIVDGNRLFFDARYCVLATGGIGRVYEYTTNSAIATGDGITFAYRMGAKIRDLHLVQFHPTAFADCNTRESFLISEAVRGEGAYLLNCNGERFMQDYDERLELAPRDVVSRSIIFESKKTGSRDFYLDISHKDPEFLKGRFPMIYGNLKKVGFDLTKDRIPIFPCQHYLMGGINVDSKGETSIDGLYAAGECSHTGVHGNNRLASNSLLEALVFPRQLAQDINEKFENLGENTCPLSDFADAFPASHVGKPLPAGIRTEVRRIMQSAYFVIPDMQAAVAGFEWIKEIKRDLDTEGYAITHDFIEARSLVTIAYIILKEVI
ncbi:MAG TPA: FAD-binding protein, partial [Oscillospiraceae bacterium]|nr:FAD-binding protein [Oscillospiraceae bacterium]